MNVTIKDVARIAQVSVATVSRALNGHPNVAESVRARVLGVATELRYSPHHAARSLSSRRTYAIGVVLPELRSEFFTELMRGIDQVARERGLHLLVSGYHDHVEAQAAALRTMRGRVDGLLVMPVQAGNADSLAENIAALPTVLMNSRSADAGCNAVGIDNYNGARAMVRHLVDAGHRRIAFIAGPGHDFDAIERLRGYRDALADILPEANPWVAQGEFDEASGQRAGRELLAALPRPDAVFAANDRMALGCLSAFDQAGVGVPRDIALAGFDDIARAACAVPSLTTMRVDIAELGRRALRALLDDTRDGQPGIGHAPLLPELIVRESSVSRA